MAQPADLAGEFLKGVQTAGQLREAQNRLNQQAEETSQRLSQQAQQNQQEHDLEQQRIAVEQQYHQQEIGLRKQQLQQVEQVNAAKTANAARQFQARQQWEQGFSRIDADTTMTPEQKDAAKTSFIMKLAPMMGIAGTEASAMLRDMRPAKPTVPASVVDKGDFLQVTQPNGQSSIHFKPKAASEKDPNVKVRLPEGTTTMSMSQAQRVIPSLDAELQKDPVNLSVMGAPKTTVKNPFTEGTTIRSKKDGKIYKIVNGQPVPQDDGQ